VAHYHGPDSFNFRAHDGQNHSNTASIDITVTPVNNAPVAVADQLLVAPDGSRDGAVAATDVDPGDTLRYYTVTGPAHGQLTRFDTYTGEFTYEPDAGYVGPDSFTFFAHDGTSGSNIATISVLVQESGWPNWIDPSLPDYGIQDDIDALAASGGGTLVLPAGTYELSAYLYLESNVTLAGQGDQTVLTLGEQEQRRDVVSTTSGSNRITVSGDVSGLGPGTLVSVWRSRPMSWLGYLRHLTVDHVDGQDVVFTEAYPYTTGSAQDAYISWGKTTKLKATAVQGGSTIRVDHPELFRVGHAICYEGSGDPWGQHFNVITSINGDTLTLDRPAGGASAGTVVYQGHSMITAYGESNVGVEDLVIEGWPEDYEAAWTAFYRGGIHTTDVNGLTVRGVTVRNWLADGISVQGGSNALVTETVSHGNHGHGFHPGTGLSDAEWTYLEGYENWRDGLYYCWHNNNVNVRHSHFHHNGEHGIGGLGQPGDINNTIEYNVIEYNGRAGIFINGGNDAYNTIRHNTIRNNSTDSAGAYAGIHFHTNDEAKRRYTIQSNTFESTTGTQRVAIQEHNTANYNTISGNTFSGHVTDVIVYGSNTTVDEPGDNVVNYGSGGAAPVSEGLDVLAAAQPVDLLDDPLAGP
jgi:parallel beta-helix repeat protein